MKILHLITSLNTGGAERMLAKLVTGMDGTRFENRVISMLAPGPVALEIESADIPVESLGLSRGMPHPGALWRLMGMMRSFRPDVVQTWLYHADLLGLLASFLSGRPPVVWNIRNADLELTATNRMTSAVLCINARLSKFPAAVVSNSRQAVEFHEQAGYKPRQWAVLPNGFDIDTFKPDAEARAEFRRELNLPDDAVLVGHCARFDPIKDHATFLAAARSIARDMPEAHFVMCGDGVTGDNAETSLFADALADPVLGTRLHLLGRRSRVERFMAGLDVFCLTSLSEGFPNVLGEAMACGVPCITTNTGDCRDIVGETGLIISPADVAGLVEALRSLLSLSPHGRRAKGLAARKRIVAQYSLSAIVANYQNLYSKIIAV